MRPLVFYQTFSKCRAGFPQVRAGMTRVLCPVCGAHSSPTTGLTTITYSYKSEGASVRLLHGWKEFILNPYRESPGEKNDMAHPLRLIKV